MHLLLQLVKSHKNFLMLCLSLSIAATVYSATPDYIDIVLGGDGTASSSGALSPPDMALDGRTETHWGNDSIRDASHPDSVWLYVDFRGKYLIDSVHIKWDSAGAKEYYVQVSDSATDTDANWTNVAHITDGVNLENRGIKFTAVQTNYLRIRCIHRIAGASDYRINGLEVWGSEVAARIISHNINKSSRANNGHAFLINGRALSEKQSLSKVHLPIFKK